MNGEAKDDEGNEARKYILEVLMNVTRISGGFTSMLERAKRRGGECRSKCKTN